jgi:hypothetical protein
MCVKLALRLLEEHRLKVFKNRVLRRIFGPRSEDVTEDWRKLHNEDFHDSYSQPIHRVTKT